MGQEKRLGGPKANMKTNVKCKKTLTPLEKCDGIQLHHKLRNNPELVRFELEGLKRGDERGKAMNYSVETIFESLQKQWKDVEEAWRKHRDWKNASDLVMVKLADLRNNAGLLFLKLKERHG